MKKDRPQPPNGKCFAKHCDECNWWRQREFEKLENGRPSGVKEIRWCCEWETLLNGMHYHMGSLDGMQEGVNEARNRSIETKVRVEEFGQAVYQVVSNYPKLLGD
jgi:hypothetical protein